MKVKFLHFALTAALSCTGLNSYAQSWTEPVDPMDGGSLELTDGAVVVFYNVEAGMFMTGGNKVSAPWATQTSLVSSDPLSFKLIYNEEEESWTIQTASGTHSGKNVVSPNASGDQPYLYIDASGDPNQGCTTWFVDGSAESGYTFDLTAQDELAPEGTYLGTPAENNLNVVCNANPDEGGQVYWQFISPEDAATIGPKVAAYKVRCELYLLADEAPSAIDLTPYKSVYDNAEATAEELEAALGQLKAAILEHELNGGGYEPTPEDPLDITDQVLVNTTFDTDVSGWTSVGGMDHSPAGATYTNEDSQISDFCEKWTWAKNHTSEYSISQTVNLPAGLYRLEADCLATCQQDQSISVSGVNLYVKNEGNYAMKVATSNNAPKHYVIEFNNDGTTPVTIGFGCEATTDANWIAIDNIKLYNCGKSTKTAAFYNLQNAVAAGEVTFPEDQLDDLDANNDIKVAYSEALGKAQNILSTAGATDAQYEEAQGNYEKALASLTTSSADYSALRSIERNFSGIAGALLEIDNEEGSMEAVVTDIAGVISELCDERTCDAAVERVTYKALNNAYNDLLNLFSYTSEKKEANADKDAAVAAIEKYEAEMRQMWINGSKTLTSEQVAAKKSEIADAVGKFNRIELEPGDVTDEVLNNPTFEENVDGWDNVGGMGHDPNGTVYTNGEVTVQSFCEKWTWATHLDAAANISQTVYIPSGLYRLEADAIATQQSNSSVVVEGVRLYVKNGETHEVAVATGNEKPQHFVIEFYNDETKGTEIGFGCDATTTANWIAVDNFQLTYIGNSAKDFAETIEYLIIDIDEMISEGHPTADIAGKISKAKEDAASAIKTNDAQACLDAIDMLKEVKNEIAPALEATKKLSLKYEYYMSVAAEVSTTGKNSFDAYMSDVMDKLTGAKIENAAAVSPIIEEMSVKFTEFVQADAAGASEDKPYDMTAAIINPEFYCEFAMEHELYDSEYNAFGWEGDEPTVNENAAEYWRNTWTAGVDCHQTIKGLAPGYYKLHVNGYNRQGQGYDHEIYKDSWATLYAGNYSTRLLDVLAGKQDYEVAGSDEHEIVEVVDGDSISYFYPTMMGSTRVYFDEGYYKNTLVFKVDEGQKEITIGVSKTVYTDTWDSLAFDDWSLEYVGTTEPAETSTAVKSVALGTVASTQIFNVNGVQMNKLAKGINIIKKVDESGNVKVSKVLVK